MSEIINMIYTFKIAENTIAVDVPRELPGWQPLKDRYEKFAVASGEEPERPGAEPVPSGEEPVRLGEEPVRLGAEPVLQIEVKAGHLTACEAEMIYEPEHQQIGLVASRAYRFPDGRLLLEFMHNKDISRPRLQMTMSLDMKHAEIMVSQEGAADDHYFLTHAILLAYMMATVSNGTLVMHASAVEQAGRAYLFQGKSGTGKSTHASLWVKNIPGAELLNDDNPIIRFDEAGRAIAYGSPWSGKTHCYRNVSAPIGAFVRIVRGQENELKRLDPLRAYASLTTSIFTLPFLNGLQRSARHAAIERLALSVPCCEMHCRPDADAAIKCRKGIRDIN